MPRLAFRRKKKIHVVSNETAGKDMGRKHERDAIISMLEKAFSPRDADADIKVFRTHSLRDLDGAKESMRRETPDLIAVFGGDGTIQKLLGEGDGFAEEMHGARVRPAYLFYGGGSTDTIKGELKVLGRDSVKATERIIKKIQRGLPLTIIHPNYLKINGKRGFIYGSGLAATLLEKYNEKTPKGPQRLAKIAAWMLFNETFRFLPPWRRRSVAQKVPVAHEFWSDDRLVLRGVGNRSAIVASTLGQVGMGCKLTNRAYEQVAHFHCILSGLGFWRTLLRIPPIFAGMPMTGNVVDEIATKVVLEYGEPILHTIDGEVYTPEEMTDRVVIELGPWIDVIRS